MSAALEISAAAEAIPQRYFRSDIAIEDKPDESPVTVADRETEKCLRAEIAARFPTHGIFGEEFGKTETQSEYTWIVDPIDGTRSFICSVPLFGMLLGVLQDGEPVAGVIRMPALGEVYAGCRGGGASMNGATVRCRTRPIDKSYVFINEANLLVRRDPERLERLMQVGHDYRFFNDCYSFALLAAGRIDAVVDTGLQPYDYLPVVPVIEAAGGIVTDWQGEKLRLGSDGTLVAAATPELHEELMKRLT
jgi:histidinol phosphatase-like enzyme (inositol monophosphatase family)